MAEAAFLVERVVGISLFLRHAATGTGLSSIFGKARGKVQGCPPRDGVQEQRFDWSPECEKKGGGTDPGST
jgi:hypothetical protein